MSETFTKNYARLNPEQRRAVDEIEGPVMVLAGPGTGKTQVLATRIAKILKETQTRPWNILCLTFTESGVAAMRERLAALIGPAAYQIRLNTFHSFANDIIRDHPEIFARAADWQALSEIERLELIRNLIDELPAGSRLKPFGQPYSYALDIIRTVQQLKQEDISPEQFEKVLGSFNEFIRVASGSIDALVQCKPKERTEALIEKVSVAIAQAAQAASLPDSVAKYLRRLKEEYDARLGEADGARAQGCVRTAYKNDVAGWFKKLSRDLPKQMELLAIYRRYRVCLIELGRYDYEDMILSVVRELSRSDELLAEYQERWQYILVDEYQDTNGAQNEIIKLLGSFDDAPNIFVVGDDKQSIYRFQGASMSNMLDFFRHYERAVRVISLKRNYRSQPEVITAAQHLISHNAELLSKYITGASEDLTPAAALSAEPLRAITFATDADEAAGVAAEIKNLIEAGVAPAEIAVLARYNKDLPDFLAALQSAGVPARVAGGENVLADHSIQQLLTLLHFLADISREDLLAEILRYRWWGFDELATLQLIHRAGSTRQSLFGLLSDAQLAGSPYQAWLARIAKWHAASVNLTLPHFTHQVLNESGWLSWVSEAPSAADILRKLNILLDEAKSAAAADRKLSLEQFIGRLEMLEENGLALVCETWSYEDASVRLMTAHKAKGLEFEYVFIARGNNKHWGNNREVSKISLPAGFIRYDYILAQENNEDERRLFYVALTRAKKMATLTRARANARGRALSESVFWQELPADAVCRQSRLQDEAARPERWQLAAPPVAAAEIQAWLKSVLRRYAMSVTHLNNYLECPRKFYVKNILRVPSIMTAPQALGTAIHAALDAYHRENWFKLPLEAARERLAGRFQDRLSREILTPREFKESLAVGQKILAGYFDRYAAVLSRPALVEYDFSSHGVNIGGLSLTGKIDKIVLADAADSREPEQWPAGAEVVVTDYKTGNPDAGLSKIKPGRDYHRQLVFYQLLAENSPRFPYKISGAEIDFVQPSKQSAQFIRKTIVIGPHDIEELTETIAQVWAEIQALNFLTGDVRPFCGQCEYCAGA